MEITQASLFHQGAPLNLSDHQVDKMHQHLLELQRVVNPSSLENNKTFQGREDFRGEKECCRKRLRSAKPPVSSDNEQTEVNQGQNFPSLIHNFACPPGEWGIKPYFFEKGPHVGVKKAFMRRMPKLVTNPLDSLVADVSGLSISCNDAKEEEFIGTNGTNGS